MALGYESQTVNGQLINVAPGAAYDPIIFGPAYTDPGMWPRQGVYNTPPALPSPELQQAMAPAAYGGGGNLVMPTVSSNPFHPTKSPLIAAIVLLVFAVAMLHFVHFR